MYKQTCVLRCIIKLFCFFYFNASNGNFIVLIAGRSSVKIPWNTRSSQNEFVTILLQIFFRVTHKILIRRYILLNSKTIKMVKITKNL